MKFTNVVLLLSGVAYGTAIQGTANVPETHQYVKRAANVIEQGLYNISNSTQALTKDIKGFSVSGLFSLQAANTMAVQTIMTAITEIGKSPPITEKEALALVPIIQMLATTTNQSVETTIDKKAAFGGVSPVVKANLQQQFQASEKLTTTISTKLPKALVSTSATLSAPIFKSLQMGIAAFNTPNVNTPQNSPELFRPVGNSAGSLAPSSAALSLTLAVVLVAAAL